MERTRTTPLLGLVAAALLLAAPAAAQPYGAADGPDAPPPLPFVLRLRTEQAGAWRAYKDELALERADGAHAGADAAQLDAMTTPQRLDWSLAQLPRQEAQARRRAAAVRAFYAALSPDQRRTFDRVTRPSAPPQERPTARARPSLPLPPEGAGLPAPGRG